ncbi:MAG: hypothetical protein KDD40_09585 [Bdellovibrionales bacterium]|nr:hypothetical protein [Bdellovibrionales bacterium]
MKRYNFSRKTYNQIYHKWLDFHRENQAKYLLVIAMVFMAFLIPFDFLLFKDGGGFPAYRLIFIGFLLILSLCFHYCPRAKSKRVKNFTASFILISIGVSFNVLYNFFYFYKDSGEYNSVVFIANFMVIFFTTFFSHRMRFEQVVNSTFSMIVLMFIGFHFIAQKEAIEITNVLLLLITHIASAIVAIYFRREFLLSLEQKYNLLLAFMPKILAEYIVVANGFENIDENFKPKNRYTVCLCADWRNYQQITKTYSSEKISQITEDFYNNIFEVLDKIDPSGQYYANWTADELFIIFYDNDDNADLVNEKSLKFANKLATEIFLDVRYETDINLRYDIGLASGVGLLGLQGPAKFKKTTITGQSAGEAKRLETEAKSLRKLRGDKNPNPILILDAYLYEYLSTHNIMSPSDFNQILASTKDIKGKEYYTFQSNFFDVQKITMPA